MPRFANSAALVLATSLMLVGCAAQAPTSDTSIQTIAPSDAGAATGTMITGDGYSYSVPEGWDIPDESAQTAQSDTVAVDFTDQDGFSDNVNVVKSPAGEVTPEQVESAGVKELETAGALDVTARDRVSVAGSESAHLSAGFSAQGVQYQIEQYYLTEGGQTYVVTFSFSDTLPESERDAVSSSILATWAWS